LAKELPRAVWSHNTSIYRATKFTPFKLLFGEEPVTPEEMKLHSARTNTEAIHNPSEAESKYLLEPEHMKAVENLQSYQNEKSMGRQKCKAKTHRTRGSGTTMEPPHRSFRKLEPKWTGLFVVVEKTKPGSFHLADNEGMMLEHSWNIDNLCRFFI
jgi:hypothetical protein